MRIVGGKYKRRRFDVPKSFNARPTTDFAKENLFNVLANLIDLEGKDCLDLFAGTGSISVELLSRSCASLLSIEKRREHSRFILSLRKELHEEEKHRVFQGDVFKVLKGKKLDPESFDFIFADPPYQIEGLDLLPDLIIQDANLLKNGGFLVLEHPAVYDFQDCPFFEQHRSYGSVNFSFFRKKTNFSE